MTKLLTLYNPCLSNKDMIKRRGLGGDRGNNIKMEMYRRPAWSLSGTQSIPGQENDCRTMASMASPGQLRDINCQQ